MEHPQELKVKEALSKDNGRGIIRIDPADLKAMGIAIGDYVAIEGERQTAAKAMPCFAEERGQQIIQMDGLLRENAGTALGKKVQIRKVVPEQAKTIHLQPLTTKSLFIGNSEQPYWRAALEGMAVNQNDRIRVKLLGAGQAELKVVGTVPQGVVKITSQTQIKLKGQQKAEQKGRISYEDIGGLRPQLHKIREMIELPLSYPQIFEHLGIEPPKGVLLSGPPGTGKTLIARAVAHETNCHFISVSGPEIMGKLYGESESKLRKIFEDAKRNAPAIIFIDEIDSIAPRRDSIGDEKQVERRVVAQLLALLDGLESRGQLMVIAATNLPNSIDPALRRPGRFDRELRVPVPDKFGRLEILQIHTNGMPLADDVELEKLAAITHGYVGTDLAALSREAAMCALRKVLPDIDFEAGNLPEAQLQSLNVSLHDFLEAMKDIEPSAVREFFAEVPNVKWEDVGGLESAKAELQEAVEWPLKYPDAFEKAGVKPPKGILLHGPPGTGKTLLAKAAASQTGVNFIPVKGPEIMSKYIGDSEKAIRQVFKTARQAAPTILFFDEIDAILPQRSTTDSGVAERIIGQFLTEMDGLEELKDVMVLAATNRKDMMDPAILRSGRFDLLLEIPQPSTEARLEILSVHLKDKPLADGVSVKAIAQDTAGCSGADLELIAKKAAMFAVKAYISQKQPNLKISQGMLNDAVEEVKKQHLSS